MGARKRHSSEQTQEIAPERARRWPQLKAGEYAKTSNDDRRYNCIAWAAGETHRWWEPLPHPFAYWPGGAPREVTVEAFVAAFELLGYNVATDDSYHPDFDKVAIFANPDGEPTHMARQLPGGDWTSKLGDWDDIRHKLSALEGDFYGHVVQVLERRKASGDTAKASEG